MRIGIRHIGIILFVWFFIAPTLALSSSTVTGNTTGYGNGLPVGSSLSTRDTDNTRLLFFHVQDGRIKKTAYRLGDIEEAATISIDGYVAGIVADCHSETEILLDKRRLRKVTEDANASFSLDYFGRLDQQEFWDKNLEEAPVSDRESECPERPIGQRYAAFPDTVLLDTVSTDQRFQLQFRHGDRHYELTVNHSGYRDVDRGETSDHDRSKPRFRYLGNRALKVENLSDFDERLDAIAQGIARVERTFGLQLVEDVNLVDYEGLQNALTRAGWNDIWFFIDAFSQETISELQTIAAHETLHLLVDHFHFTGNYQIRKLFADLKRYDELSLERFYLLTRGELKEAAASPGEHPLFSFIDEKHFLGRKGGHSHQNLDEFCTSLIHSLMFLDRIDRNLSLPLKSGSAGTVRNLTDDQKSEILAYYLKSIGILQASVSGQDSGAASRIFFKTKQAYIDALISSRNNLDTIHAVYSSGRYN